MKNQAKKQVQHFSLNLNINQLYSFKNVQFRSLNEAHEYAQALALACPNPALAAMGLTEIFLNAIEHGNLGLNYNEKASFKSFEDWLNEVNRRLLLRENIHKYVKVEVETNTDQIKFTVTDCGYGFDWEKYQKGNNMSITNRNGRGIILASNLAFDKVTYFPPGNKVECLIHRSSYNLPSLPRHHF